PLDSLNRRLELGNRHCGPCDQLSVVIQVLRAEQGVGARRHHYRVFPLGVNDYESYTGGGLRHRPDLLHLDSGLVQAAPEYQAEVIIADPAYEPHLGAEPGGGHCLVGTLTTRQVAGRAGQDRLAWTGYVWRRHNEVHVHAAEDDQAAGSRTVALGRAPPGDPRRRRGGHRLPTLVVADPANCTPDRASKICTSR